MMLDQHFIDKIRRRIGRIPANNPSVLSMYQTTLENVLDRALLDKIAEEAVDEVRQALSKGDNHE